MTAYENNSRNSRLKLDQADFVFFLLFVFLSYILV